MTTATQEHIEQQQFFETCGLTASDFLEIRDNAIRIGTHFDEVQRLRLETNCYCATCVEDRNPSPRSQKTFAAKMEGYGFRFQCSSMPDLPDITRQRLPYNVEEDALEDLAFLTQRIATLPRTMQIACWNGNSLPLVKPNDVKVTKCPSRNVSGGFRWNDQRLHRKVKPQILEEKKEPPTLEDFDAFAEAWAASTPVVLPPPPRRDTDCVISTVPRTSTDSYDGTMRRAHLDSADALLRLRGDGRFNLTGCSAKSEKYGDEHGVYTRIPIGDLPQQPTEEDIEELNEKLKAANTNMPPTEPKGIGKIIVRRRNTRLSEAHADGKARPVFDDKTPLGDLWLTPSPNAPDAGERMELFRVYFRGATPEEVARDEEAKWMYVEVIDPEQFASLNLSEAQKRAKRRKEEKMRKIFEGKCPSGTCVNDRCANPELSYTERRTTHAANLLKHAKEKLSVGTWYAVVMLQGQPRFKVLDIAGLPGALEEDRAWAAIERLQAASPNPEEFENNLVDWGRIDKVTESE